MPPPRALDGLVEMAQFHQIAPAVYLHLKDAENTDGEQISRLQAAYHSAVRRHLFSLRELPFLTETFAGLGGPWLVIKGPVLSEAVYMRPDLRAYVDLDVVVPGSLLGPALRLLEGAGASVVDDDWRLMRQSLRGELRVLLPSGMLVDLHWHVLSHAELRRSFAVSMDALFARRRTVTLGVHRVETLDPVDTLVHLAVHACLAGGNRLVWVKDMEQCLASEHFSWDAIVERTQQWSAGPAVATLLARVSRLFAVEVPKETLSALGGGRSWSLLVAALDRMAPIERATGKKSLARMVSRATRSDARSSFVELRRRATAWASHGAPTGTPGSEAHHRKGGSASLIARGSGPRERATFLDAVAQASAAGVSGTSR